jgi:hypothetical protein
VGLTTVKIFSTISVTNFFSDTAGNLRIIGYQWHIDMEFWKRKGK